MMTYMNYSQMPVTDGGLGIVVVSVVLLVALFVSIFFFAETLRGESLDQNKKHRSMRIRVMK